MRGKEVGERKWVFEMGVVVDTWGLTTVLSLAVPVWFQCKHSSAGIATRCSEQIRFTGRGGCWNREAGAPARDTG